MCGSGNLTYTNFLPPTLKLFLKNLCSAFRVHINKLSGRDILHICTIIRLKLSQEDEYKAQ